MIANRRSPGTISRNNSRRLPPISACCFDIPVTLPPGRERLVTRPLPSGSTARANTGNGSCDLPYDVNGTSIGYDHIDLEADEFGCDLGGAFVTPFRPATFYGDIASLDPAEFVYPLGKAFNYPQFRMRLRGTSGDENLNRKNPL